MIRINLLPVEKRRAERTPVPRFFLILATVGMAAGVFFYILFIILEINRVGSELEEQQKLLQRLQPQVSEHDRLVQQKTAAENKLREISGVLARSVPVGFWRLASAVWDVLNAHHKVWIDDFRMMDATAAQAELKRHHPDTREAPLYGLAMRCHVAGSEVSEMTRFRKALKEHPVLMEHLPIINFNPDWKVDEERDTAQRHSISFSVALFGGGKSAPQAPSKKPGGRP